ncbi:MAG: hypothetical protein U1E59_03720 [Amaricoccus sp.]
MRFLHACPPAPILLALSAGIAFADGPASRGHALGPDLAALSVPLATAGPARGGHALGPDVAALRQPLECGAEGPCATDPTLEATIEPAAAGN